VQPGTNVDFYVGQSVGRSFVFIYISGSTFVFNIFWVALLPPLGFPRLPPTRGLRVLRRPAVQRPSCPAISCKSPDLPISPCFFICIMANTWSAVAAATAFLSLHPMLPPYERRRKAVAAATAPSCLPQSRGRVTVPSGVVDFSLRRDFQESDSPLLLGGGLSLTV